MKRPVLVSIIQQDQIDLRMQGKHQFSGMGPVPVLKVWNVGKLFLEQTKFVVPGSRRS